MADPSALPPSLIEKVLDPNNLVAVVTVGLMYMLYKFTSKRFELEAEEQKAIIERMDDLHDELLKLEGKVEAIANRANHER
jgi:formiminotetrahydrofolate cyclodeaminase